VPRFRRTNAKRFPPRPPYYSPSPWLGGGGYVVFLFGGVLILWGGGGIVGGVIRAGLFFLLFFFFFFPCAPFPLAPNYMKEIHDAFMNDDPLQPAKKVPWEGFFFPQLHQCDGSKMVLLGPPGFPFT